MPLPRILKSFLWQLAFWTVLCLAVEAFCHAVLHLGAPYDYPGVHAYTSFADFHSFVTKFASFHHASFFSSGPLLPYPPLAVAAYKLFLTPQPHPPHGKIAVALYALSILAVSWIMLLVLGRALRRRGLSRSATALCLAALYLSSFPFWFEMNTGNIEFLVWTLTTAGIGFFWRKRSIAAAVCFGLAFAMKLFPLVFLALFLARRQYRALVLALLVAAFTTVAALWLIDPNIAESLRLSIAALHHFGHEHVETLQLVSVGFDHSLFALIKRMVEPFVAPRSMRELSELYLALAGLLGGILFFVKIRTLPLVNQVLCLTIAGIVLPPVSYDYTLLHLYASLALLLFVVMERRRNAPGAASVPGMVAALALLAFLLSAQSEFIADGIRFAGQLKCIALLALAAVALRYPFELREGGVHGPALMDESAR